jgi:hypothetical protein
MQAAVRRLTRTVNLLLETTRLEEGQLQLQREWCEAHELVAEAIQLSDLHEHAVSTLFSEKMPHILCDVPLLAQALSFMIGNAAQHSPPTGRLKLPDTPTRTPSFLRFAIVDTVLWKAKSTGFLTNSTEVRAVRPGDSASDCLLQSNWWKPTEALSAQGIARTAAPSYGSGFRSNPPRISLNYEPVRFNHR